MIIGYLIVGVVTGMAAFVVSLVMGASIWLALGYYTLVGAGTMLVTAGLRYALVVPKAVRYDSTGRIGEVTVSNPASGAEQGSMRILAVDDDPFILELIPMIAAKSGFTQITTAPSGADALRVLQDDPDFDCLLVDISMAKMDGIELCKHVRALEAYRLTPIIMLTAMRDLKNMGNAFRAGATDYATKPFDIDELGTRLRIAQEEVAEARRSGAPHAARDLVFSLPEGLREAAGDNLVERSVLMNYLTAMARRETTQVEVFAVRVDPLADLKAQLEPAEFARFLGDVAKAGGEAFSDRQTLVGYAANGDLLVVAKAQSHSDSRVIERTIERQIAHWADALDTKGTPPLMASVGGPVRPGAERAQRAVVAFGNAIAFAEKRSAERNGAGRLHLVSG
ncbi:response regulator [Oceaniglobus trochenteri]|uniref:response regulator n=1 Tax=Oceaniglobus trochenteri TaxID=2763260 RepID=UPI001CFF99BF|nr:response regulator [Oceaniglobus trochenteri]